MPESRSPNKERIPVKPDYPGARAALSKVPEVTLLFWIIKIAATTLGETAGDAVSMSLGLGYLMSTAIFAIAFVFAVGLQVRARSFHPALYWFAIIATTTVGTTLADFADRTLGIGYAGGATLLALLMIASLALWKRTRGSIAVGSVVAPADEAFYWTTILFSQTLGTALGDWTADAAGLGYAHAMLVFAALIAVVAALYFWSRASRTLLFWAAFVLTRPLGAVVGDFLDKPVASGGLALSRFVASGALLLVIAICIAAFPQRAARRAH
jgi:uncharacterized membrane-anchored protein